MAVASEHTPSRSGMGVTRAKQHLGNNNRPRSHSPTSTTAATNTTTSENSTPPGGKKGDDKLENPELQQETEEVSLSATLTRAVPEGPMMRRGPLDLNSTILPRSVRLGMERAMSEKCLRQNPHPLGKPHRSDLLDSDDEHLAKPVKRTKSSSENSSRRTNHQKTRTCEEDKEEYHRDKERGSSPREISRPRSRKAHAEGERPGASNIARNKAKQESSPHQGLSALTNQKRRQR